MTLTSHFARPITASARPYSGPTATVTGGDPTGIAPSSDAIEAARDLAGVGGTVVLPAGTWRISRPIIPLEGQTWRGQGIDVTIVRADVGNSIANFPSLAMFQGISATAFGNTENHNVIIEDLTVNGGRSEARYTDEGKPEGKVTGEQVEDRLYDTVSCPDGWAGGISLTVGWTVRRVRFTNINGHKCGTFGSHGATVEDCVWDNLGNDEDPAYPATSGERDQIGGGAGVTDLTIRRCYFDPSCVGSGIDLTQGRRVLIEDCRIHAFSLILEGINDFMVRGNYIGPLGAEGGGGNINIKSNAAYASSLVAGAYQPRNGTVRDNVIVGATGAPGVVINYSDHSRTGFPLYVSGGNNLIENNSTIDCKFGGVAIIGNTAGAKTMKDTIIHNRCQNVIAGTAGLGDEWNSGAGMFQPFGVAIMIGTGDVIFGNSVHETRDTPPTVHGVHLGGRSQSAVPFADTYVAANTTHGITGSPIREAA